MGSFKNFSDDFDKREKEIDDADINKNNLNGSFNPVYLEERIDFLKMLIDNLTVENSLLRERIESLEKFVDDCAK